MSILITTEDTTGKGKPLPNAKWSGVFEEASITPEGNGTRFFARLGQITTPDGNSVYTNGGSAPYNIGNRKVFVREWTDHTSVQATEIGQRRIKQIIIAAGLAPKPTAGQTVEVNLTFEQVAAEVVGKRVLFSSKQVARLSRKQEDKDAWSAANPGANVPDLVPALDSDGTPKIDVEVSVFHSA